MSERRSASSSDPAADQADLDRIADALYAVKPDDFADTRDAEVRAAREAGRQPLAREIARLRKPTQSAWLLNLLWRDQHDVMEQLFQLAHEFTRAQAESAGPALRELMTQRRQLEHALMRRAVELGNEAGTRVSDSVEREAQETLSAALAIPEVADEVRSGRLVKATSYAGFGGSGAGTAGAPAASRPAPSHKAAAAPPSEAPAPIDLGAERQRRAAADADTERSERQRPADTERSEGKRRGAQEHAERERRDAEEHAEGERRDAEEHAERERRQAEERAERERRAAEERAERERREAVERAERERREALERALASARAALHRADARVTDTAQVVEDAAARAADLRKRTETLRAQLARAEADQQHADRELADAESARDEAEAAQTEAQRTLAAAEAALNH